MKKLAFLLFKFIITLFVLFTTLDCYGQTSVFCYPSNNSEATGRVDFYGKYDDLIRVGKGSLGQNIRGWTVFDISNIPSNATIVDLELRIDIKVSSTSSEHDIDFRRMTLYPSQHSATDIINDIDNGVCYNCSFSSEGTSV